jgi:glycosyltransferase involved in cell wall biosynthesis
MRICLVGGIYGKKGQNSRFVHTTPETTLETGLRSRGHSVSTRGHYDQIDYTPFDVVHVHHLSFGAVAASCNRSSTPFVFTAHDVRGMEGSLSAVRTRALGFVLSRAHAVIALSTAEKKYMLGNFKLNREPVVIPNGIDSRIYSFVHPNHRQRKDRWTILYVGQLIGLKRVDVLIDALAQLPTNVELLLASHNPKLEDELKAQSRKLGVSDRVVFLGAKHPSELAGLYQRADVFVLPSSSEALPSVVSEAMFCGTPVVATAVGGVPEQLGRFGITVRPGDSSALAAALSTVFRNYSEFSRQAPEMSDFARGRFSIECMIHTHSDLYDGLGKESRTTRGVSLFNLPVDLIARTTVRYVCRRKRVSRLSGMTLPSNKALS